MASLIRRDPTGTVLYQEIVRQIANGDLKHGQAILSTTQLQKKFCLSLKATLAALDRLAREGLIERRANVGTFVTDNGKIGPPALPYRMGFLQVPAARGFFVDRICSAAVSEFKRLALDCAMFSAWEEVVSSREKLDCVIVTDADRVSIARLLENEVPFVLCGAGPEIIHLSHGDNFDIVGPHSMHGGYLAGRRLKRAGCAKAVFVGVERPVKHGGRDALSWHRLEGFLDGYGAQVSDIDIIWTPRYEQLAGADAAEQWFAMDPRPNGVFCASDDLALGFYFWAKRSNIQAGKDYSLIGFDGQPDSIRGPDFYLTTVLTPMEEIGRLAAKTAVERAADRNIKPRWMNAGCDLFEGNTVVNNAPHP